MTKYSLYIYLAIAVVAVGAGAFLVHAQYAAHTVDKKVIHYVALHASSTEPINLLLKVGEYVEFDSKDGKTHTIASGVGNGDGEKHDHEEDEVDSGEFAADEGFLVQFKKVGTFYFHDHLNPDVNISIGVYDPTVQ